MNGDPNHVHLQSVKSIELYLDSNQGNNGTEAIRVYNNINPNENTPIHPIVTGKHGSGRHS